MHLPPERGSSRATSGFRWNWREWHSSRNGIRSRRATCGGRLRLDPTDSYGNDFLGTVYFLQGNIEAALKYWNRVGKPQIVEVRSQPTPQVNAALLDRAMAFAPASVLRLPDLLTTEARVDGLEIFPRYQFDLQARDDGKFDILFRNRERDGWGQGNLEKLFLLFRGLPFQSVTPEFYNLRHQAINFVSMYRWDAEKRRVLARLSSPFKANPKFRYGIDWPICAVKTGTSGIRFRVRPRCWEVSTCGEKPWVRISLLSKAGAGSGLRGRKFRIAISAA